LVKLLRFCSFFDNPTLTLTLHVDCIVSVNSMWVLVMKKFLLLSSFALSVFLPAATALAADLEPLPPPPPPVTELRAATYDWSGAYAGGWIGLTCVDGIMTNVTTATSYLNAGCGAKGGAVIGYNQQIDNVVFGVEADYGTSTNIVTNPTPGANFKYAMDGIATVRGRFGYAFDDTMLFVTAGGAWAHGKLTDNYTAAVPNELASSHLGWTVGLGVEHAFTDQFRMKLDYLYTKFNDADYTQACCNIKGGPGVDHEVRLGAIWAF
jgi:outer membrane immunogenic protein